MGKFVCVSCDNKWEVAGVPSKDGVMCDECTAKVKPCFRIVDSSDRFAKVDLLLRYLSQLNDVPHVKELRSTHRYASVLNEIDRQLQIPPV